MQPKDSFPLKMPRFARSYARRHASDDASNRSEIGPFLNSWLLLLFREPNCDRGGSDRCDRFRNVDGLVWSPVVGAECAASDVLDSVDVPTTDIAQRTDQAQRRNQRHRSPGEDGHCRHLLLGQRHFPLPQIGLLRSAILLYNATFPLARNDGERRVRTTGRHTRPREGSPRCHARLAPRSRRSSSSAAPPSRSRRRRPAHRSRTPRARRSRRPRPSRRARRSRRRRRPRPTIAWRSARSAPASPAAG